MKEIKKYAAEINGRTLTVEFNRLAHQTNGSCTVQYGETIILATAVRSKQARQGIDFFPLMVDYEERLYAAGKIKGSRFIKREGRPTDEAVLTGRLIDRAIRPLFSESDRNDVQVVLTVFSIDNENDPAFCASLGASIALSVSDIPWNGPIGSVSLAYIDNQFIINPSTAQKEQSQLYLFVSGTEEKILMIESNCKQIEEKIVFQGLEMAQQEITKIVKFIKKIQKEIGQTKMITSEKELTPEETKQKEKLTKSVAEFAEKNFQKTFGIKSKVERKAIMEDLSEKLTAIIAKDENLTEETKAKAFTLFSQYIDNKSLTETLTTKKRIDGRQIDEVRELNCSVGLLPRTHGSGLFNRGETQVLSIATLGAPGDEQTIDNMEEYTTKKYMHHYNFPSFSVGETGPMRSPSRREIGHGALAEKALEPVLPPKEQFPYTIRVVSEVLSCNGSSSQASICGSTLALMDAGVPIIAPVAGIAMGLVEDETTEKYLILTDIQGAEDHYGFMDFKIAGTETGITAIQLDVKNKGLTLPMCQETLEKAKIARLQILKVMTGVIEKPRAELSKYAPRIIALKIDPEKIRDIIGKGGETINKIIDDCGGKDACKIDIDDDGTVMITTIDPINGQKAQTWITNITKEVTVGEIYEGPVTQIVKDRISGKEIGAIVQLLPGHDGMVHISQLSNERIAMISDAVKIGEIIKVKVMEVDKERGRISLSRAALLPRNENSTDYSNNERSENRPPRTNYRRRDNQGKR